MTKWQSQVQTQATQLRVASRPQHRKGGIGTTNRPSMASSQDESQNASSGLQYPHTRHCSHSWFKRSPTSFPHCLPLTHTCSSAVREILLLLRHVRYPPTSGSLHLFILCLEHLYTITLVHLGKCYLLQSGHPWHPISNGHLQSNRLHSPSLFHQASITV
jgi:hypothetical protein